MRKYFHRAPPDAKGANIYLFCFVSTSTGARRGSEGERAIIYDLLVRFSLFFVWWIKINLHFHFIRFFGVWKGSDPSQICLSQDCCKTMDHSDLDD